MDRSTLLTLLRESESYISGQEISRRLGVTRSAVWKAIGLLRADGYEIEAVSNRGYRLVSIPDKMSYEEISSRLTTEYIARDLHYYDETDSTNIRIRRLAEEGAAEGTLAVSDMQSAGRGRRGRGWVSPSGTNIYMSLLLKPDISPSDAPMVTLIMALSVAAGICAVSDGRAQVRIKWPNDIVINGRKVCGILTEMDMEADYIRDVIVGVGINVNQADVSSFPEEIRDMASSLRIEFNRIINRSGLIAAIMSEFENNYDIFLASGDLRELKDKYEDMLISMDREVKVLDPKGEYTGIARGIDTKGELLVETPDGEVTRVYAGEVSVRGLYGYV